MSESFPDGLLLPDERLDDLQFKGLFLIQSGSAFRFGTDSVLLAGFARPKRTDSCIDLGAGSGVLTLLLAARTGCRMTAVERDAAQCSRLARSVRLNGLDSIDVINADYIVDTRRLGLGAYDSAVCNPPYFSRECGCVPENGEATHELTADIVRIAAAASLLLKFGGKLFLCFPCSRLSEAFAALNSAGLEPKRLRLVSSKAEKPPYLALIEAKKGAGHGLNIECPLIIHAPSGEYTDEVKKIYHEF